MAKTAYFAASVRGPRGDHATIDEMAENTLAGIGMCAEIEKILDDWHVYCPHRHEDLYNKPWRHRDITSEQILDQCVEILGLASYIIIATDPADSQGVQVEMEYADKHNIQMIPLWMVERTKWGEFLERYRNVENTKEKASGCGTSCTCNR